MSRQTVVAEQRLIEWRSLRWVVATLLLVWSLATATAWAAKVATPVASPAGGIYDRPVAIELSCPTPGARIVYSTDGSEPDASSPPYLYPLTAAAQVSMGHDPNPSDSIRPLTSVSLELRARAFLPGMEPSDVLLARYVIDRVETVFDVAYADPPAAGGDKHMLDIYRPAGRAGSPVVVFVHGGAWTDGDRSIYFELGCTLAGNYGFLTVVPSYELSAPPWNAVHPGHVRDVAAAVAWTIEHAAEHGGDPGRIVLVGHSAGAHIAALLATDGTWLAEVGLAPERLRGVVAISGLYDLPAYVAPFANPLGLSRLEALGYGLLFGSVFGGADAARLAAASPAAHVSGLQPRFRLVHHADDYPGLAADARRFHALLDDSGGAPAELVSLDVGDIPEAIRALGFGGHIAEILAINTRDWTSVPTRAVTDFVTQLTPRPPRRRLPAAEPGNLSWVRRERAETPMMTGERRVSEGAVRGTYGATERARVRLSARRDPPSQQKPTGVSGLSARTKRRVER